MEEPLDQYKHAEKLELKDIKKEFPKIFQKVCCPSCEKEVKAENINLNESLAKCGSCDVIFSIEEEVEIVKTKAQKKPEVLRPEGIDLYYFKGDLDITVQQHIQGWDMAGLIFLPTIAFFSIVLYFAKDISIYFSLVSILGSAYYIYRALNYSKNKTYIEVNDKTLSVQSRPKNMNKDKTYDVLDIDQLYVKHVTDGTGYFTVQIVTNGLEGQKHENLITVTSLSKAKYLEQQIERYLKLEDKSTLESQHMRIMTKGINVII